MSWVSSCIKLWQRGIYYSNYQALAAWHLLGNPYGRQRKRVGGPLPHFVKALWRLGRWGNAVCADDNPQQTAFPPPQAPQHQP